MADVHTLQANTVAARPQSCAVMRFKAKHHPEGGPPEYPCLVSGLSLPWGYVSLAGLDTGTPAMLKGGDEWREWRWH